MRYLYLLIIFTTLLILGCSAEHPSKPDETGVLPIRMNLQPAIQHGFAVTLVRVRITKGAFSQEQDLQISGSTAEGTFSDLEAGVYAINVEVYDNLTLIATGQGTGTVVPAQTTTVYITLQFVPGSLDVVINWGVPYEDSRRILLVGNSHTYYNGGVNTHLEALIDNVHPDWNVSVSASTAGGYTLQDHYNDPNTLNAISTGDWDLVILQEQSSRPMQDPDLFYLYAGQLSNLIGQSGALTGFYMTWAWRNNPEMYLPIRDAYMYIGAYLDALVAPAGVAFYHASQIHDSPNLYDADNYHPSMFGTYLVACTMLAEIWNINPVGNSYRPAGIDENTALLLQQIAWDTVQGSESKRHFSWPAILDWPDGYRRAS